MRAKSPPGQGGGDHEGRFFSAQWMASNFPDRAGWLPLIQLYSLLSTAIVANCTNLGQLAILHAERCQLPRAASQRTAHNSHCLLNLSLFQKNPMNTIMLSNFLDISKLSHSEYFYIFILILICEKIKKLSEENLYFIIFLTWLRAREKPTKKKKVVVAIWCPIKTWLYYINN